MPDCPKASNANTAPIANTMSESRESRAVVVTGASSGIGRALALAAAGAGWRVLAVARRSERLEALAQTIHDTGGACSVLAGDVTARDMAARIVSAALQAFGRIDVVVNNAGTGAYGLLLEQDDAALDAQWQLHVGAPLRLARAALAELEARHGQLIFVGSGVARVPLPNWGPYSLAKAAIRAAAIQLRRELRTRGVAVTYVDPGVVATEFHGAIGIERTVMPAPPERVAHKILNAMTRRPAVVNAVPWQTVFSALAEWSGTLADPIVARFGGVRTAQPR
jgi:short-subunit dehydrogenase